MNPETGYTKEDKQTLVLLGFGVCILLLNIHMIPRPDNSSVRFYWLEIPGKDIPVFRSTNKDQIVSFFATSKGKPTAASGYKRRDESRKEIAEKAATIITPYNSLTLSPITPRLAFFLGQPLAINRANRDELLLIPGIGPVLSEKIIDYRKINGPYYNKHTLMEVPGIGPKTASRISSFFSFE